MKKILKQTITNKTSNNNPKSLKNKFIIPLLLLSLALIFSVTAGTVSATSTSSSSSPDIVYVNDILGSDDNNGTSWQWAKKSIKNATGTVNENGTVHIANGRYTGKNNIGISISKNMSIIGQSKAGTIINAEHSKDIFYIDSGITVTIKNLTLANGTASNGGTIYNKGKTTVTNCIFTGNDVDDCGGAIYNENNLTLNGCTFTDNDAEDGGAIYNRDELTVTDSTFTGNDAYDCCGGGAIYNSNTMVINGCSFNDNDADDGGAIYNADELTVTDSTFTDNEAYDCCGGGAIYNDYRCTMTVIGCTFTGNEATDSEGGAIYNEYEMTITNCTFNNNTADDVGGAIYSADDMTVIGCTFTGNDADDDGGAIYNKGEMTITGSTFTGNDADDVGGAIYNTDEVTVTGCTFKNNSAEYGGAIYGYGEMTINFCRIVGNNANGNGDAVYFQNGKVIKTTTVESPPEDPVNARYNWWGSNKPDFGKLVSGGVNYTPWLYMTINANPTTIKNGETSLITVSFNNLFNGTTRTDLDPATGHIPDGSPVNFQSDLGNIGCKSIDKTTTGGIATAMLTASELAGTAHVNATADSQTLFVNVTITPKAGLYMKVTPNKANPVVGDIVVYTLKVGNNGPDAAKDVVMTYVVPEGLEFAGANVDRGTYAYDPATRTITWIIGDVPVGDPYMWLSLRVAKSGHYLINPVLITSTYDPTLNIDTQSITINAAAKTTINAASKTIPLQKTGLPLAGLVLAILAVLSGFVPKKK